MRSRNKKKAAAAESEGEQTEKKAAGDSDQVPILPNVTNNVFTNICNLLILHTYL
jgi:hypothetical protein